MNRSVKTFSLLCALLVVTKNAFGYIDPGTGSYLLQIIAAGFLAGLYTVKVYWGNIVAFFKRFFS